MNNFSQNYLAGLMELLNRFPHEKFEQMIEVIIQAYYDERNIFVMGNGGSGATASHWACDVNKGCSFGRHGRFKMICLNDNISTMLAYANDISYEDVFVEQMINFYRPNDVVIGISGSGNSKNVLKSVEYANNNDGITIGLCGYNGGKLAQMVDIPLHADIDDMQKVEDTHMIIVHMAMQKICSVLSEQQPVKLVQEAGR